MLTVLALCLATAADPVVLMPVEGADVLPAVRSAVDGVVREAAAARLGPRLQSAADTEAVIADAVAAGLNCSLRDVACGVRVGAIAGAGEVLVPVIRPGAGNRLELSIQRLDVTRGSAVAVGATVVRISDTAALGAFLGTLLTPPAAVAVEVDGAIPGAVVVVDDVAVGALPLAAPVAVTVGPHVITIADASGATIHQRAMTTTAGFQRVSFVAPAAAGPPTPSTPSTSMSPSPLMVVGIVGVGVGGLATLAGGALTATTEVGLAAPRDGAVGYDESREFGRLMLGATVVGVVVAVGGATLMVLGGGS